jgi:ATP-dependent Clp protease adaptor protein ClpS
MPDRLPSSQRLYQQPLRAQHATEESATGVAEPPAEIEAPVEREQRNQKRDKPRPKQQPRYNVILWDDDHHTYAYVVMMMMELFGYPMEKGFELAKEVDTRGRVIVLTTTREHAELKRDQIHAYGKDALIDGCQGSMWSTIEPVE